MSSDRQNAKARQQARKKARLAKRLNRGLEVMEYAGGGQNSIRGFFSKEHRNRRAA